MHNEWCFPQWNHKSTCLLQPLLGKENNKWLQPPWSSPAFSQGSRARRQLQDLYREMRKLRPDERGSRASDSESDEGGVMGGWRVDGNDLLVSLEGSCFLMIVESIKLWINMTVSD